MVGRLSGWIEKEVKIWCTMCDLEFWKNFDFLKVDEFMCLVMGYEPGSYVFDFFSRQKDKAWPEGAELIYKLLVQDINMDRFVLSYDTPADITDAPFIKMTDYPWWHGGQIKQKALKAWVEKRKIKSKYFGTDLSDNSSNTNATPDYLNPKNPNYSFKLAAAIKAWEALTANPELLRGKGCKDAVVDWLEDNINLLDIPEGSQLSNNLKEHISFIVNWNLSGGAPKTPVK